MTFSEGLLIVLAVFFLESAYVFYRLPSALKDPQHKHHKFAQDTLDLFGSVKAIERTVWICIGFAFFFAEAYGVLHQRIMLPMNPYPMLLMVLSLGLLTAGTFGLMFLVFYGPGEESPWKLGTVIAIVLIVGIGLYLTSLAM